MQVHSPPATANGGLDTNTSENRGSHMGKIDVGKKLGGAGTT